MIISINKKYVLWVCMIIGLLCPGLWLQAQNSFDTEANKLREILLIKNPAEKIDSILSYTDSHRKDSTLQQLFHAGLQVARRNNLYSHEARLQDGLGVLKRDLSEYADALNLHKQALEIANRIHAEDIAMFALNNIGVVYRRLDQNTEALNYHIDALRIAERIKHDYSISVSLNSIGNIHIALSNYKDAIEYFQMALPIAVKANNMLGMAMNMGNIGECYDRLNQLDSAKKYYNLSLDYNRALQNKKGLKGIAICYGSLGNIYKKEGNYRIAQKLFEDGLEINKQLKDKMFIAQSYNFLGDIHLLQNRPVRAQGLFEEGLRIARAIRSKTEIRSAYEGLMKTHRASGNFEKALTYANFVKAYTDSIYLENNNRHVRQVEAMYQSEREQAKIKLLETTRKNDRIIMAGSLILFILLLITGVLYYLRNRLLERNRSLHRELEIRSQIASDLHDDMGSSLSSIHIFSELLRSQNGKSEELISKIEANAKDTLEALDDIIWLVKPSNDKFSNLGMHVRRYAIPLFESKDIRFEIDFPESIAEISLPMEARRNIFLIIKESVNNMVKYSQCTEAEIVAEVNHNNILFTIKDNGIGFDPNMLTDRNGLKNLHSRARQINAELTINAAKGKGCEIKLLVKEIDIEAVRKGINKPSF